MVSLLIIFLGVLALLILPFVFWILKIIRLSKNEDKTGMWVVLAVGIFLSPLVGWLVGLAFKEDDVKERERERERIFDAVFAILNIKKIFWAEKLLTKEKFAVPV